MIDKEESPLILELLQVITALTKSQQENVSSANSIKETLSKIQTQIDSAERFLIAFGERTKTCTPEHYTDTRTMLDTIRNISEEVEDIKDELSRAITDHKTKVGQEFEKLKEVIGQLDSDAKNAVKRITDSQVMEKQVVKEDSGSISPKSLMMFLIMLIMLFLVVIGIVKSVEIAGVGKASTSTSAPANPSNGD